MVAVPESGQRRSRSPNRLYVELAAGDAEVRASQALRYRVFAEELGANVKGAEQRLDRDHFDPFCRHLLVREHGSDRIVGTTRLLTDEHAAQAGGFYTASEFDISTLLALPGRRLEIGRTCIDPEYRQGASIAVLWSGIAAFAKLHNVRYLFGCASIGMEDGGVHAHAIMDRLRGDAMLPGARRVIPRRPMPDVPAYDPRTVSAAMPPLLKAYVRVGAKICGEPCFDPDFNCVDVCVLVDIDRMDESYARHFFHSNRVAPR